MSKGMRDENLAQDDEYLEDGNEWSETVTDAASPEAEKAAARGRPKWKAIEEYWEQKRLKDALQDYPTEEG